MNSTPENLLETLEEASTYASRLEVLIAEKDYQQENIINTRRLPESNKPHKFFYGLRIAAIVYLILEVIGIINMMSAEEYKEDPTILLIAGVIALSIPVVIICLLTSFIRKRNKYVAELEKQLPEVLKNLQDKLDETKDKIIMLHSEISKSGILHIIPKKYFNTEALDFFYQAVENKMASSLQECILLYEQELKHQQMLNQQMELAEYQSALLDKLTREVETLETWINNNKN